MSLSFEGDVSVDTADAADVLSRMDYIIASLEKAGIPLAELMHFKKIIELNRSPEFGAGATDVADDASGAAIAEGALEKLQQGVYRFAPVWKTQWVRVLPGEMQVFKSSNRPEPGTPLLFSLPLSVQQTRIESGTEALCKKLGRKAIVMVGSNTAIGGTVRCVTLAAKDDLAVQQWNKSLEKAMSQEGHLLGASIFRASQAGDILRVKELIRRGVSVNCTNAYGCTPLHYAIKTAAVCTTTVARGSEESTSDEAKVKAQDALRVIAFLMSNGADARAVNNVGDTPKDVACRLTSGLPKTRKLLISILDSSKYEVSGGIIFIVPGKPQPTRVEKEDAVENLPDPQAIVRADGVKFSPSRRNQRARTTKEIVKSRQPHTVEKKECFPARAVSKSIPTLPRGDHESAVGGTNHHLAAAFSSRRNMRRQASRYTRNGTDMRPAAADVRDTSGEDQQQPDIGVMFRDMRMVKNSSVLLNRGSKRRRLRAHCESRPITCSAGNSRGQLRDSDVARPTTTGHSTGISSPGIHDHVGSSESWSSRRQQARRRRHTPGGERGMKLAETSNARREKHDTVPDFEARRQISQWLRESAGNVVTVPATGGSRLGGHLTEKSGFVATDDRKEVYRALRTIKGEGRGELISSKRLRAMLCRTGQRLRPEEMNDLLREADPTDTGYVSCSKLSKLLTRNRLAPLAEGGYNEEEDVVMQAKARRLARERRLEIARQKAGT